jgi:NADPH2:quinone reductase
MSTIQRIGNAAHRLRIARPLQDVLRGYRFECSEVAGHPMSTRSRRIPMRAIEAKTFSGYGGLQQIELAKPQPAKGKVLVRITAAGVTPLDHTVLSGGHPRAKAPLVLGNEAAGVIEDAGESGLAVGSRVMFTGPYGVGENGAWQEWLLARPEHLAIVPDAIDDVAAASVPVAYLTAQVTLTLAGFKPGMTVLAPGIGGSVGNATYQLARAQGAGK